MMSPNLESYIEKVINVTGAPNKGLDLGVNKKILTIFKPTICNSASIE